MNHDEIRLRILQLLYQRYYEGQRYDLQITDNVFNELAFGDVDKETYYGDVLYLHNRNLIHGEMILGLSYPPWIRINENDIDFVENVLDSSMEKLDTIVDVKTREDMKEIVEEPNPSAKLKKLLEFVKLHTDLWLNIAKIMKDFYPN